MNCLKQKRIKWGLLRRGITIKLNICRLVKVIHLFTVLFLLSSCSSSESQTDYKQMALEEQEAQEDVVEKASSAEGSQRKPIFVYNDQSKKGVSLGKTVLKLNAEPLLLASSYVRLVGVVSGGRPVRRSSKNEGGPMALIEVGGKGFCVGIGDEICGHRVSHISQKELHLTQGGGE